jgi:hypothetical protein
MVGELFNGSPTGTMKITNPNYPNDFIKTKISGYCFNDERLLFYSSIWSASGPVLFGKPEGKWCFKYAAFGDNF